jgi:hypothetical protein
MITRRNDPAQNALELRVLTNQAEQRFTFRAVFADAEDVLGRRVEANDKKGAVEQNDACAEAVENLFRVFVEFAAARTFGPATPA